MRPRHVVLLLVAAFGLRLAYGLSSELFGPDESQVFLIGLQYYTTGHWPYLGPDVVYTHTQLAGALQGLLIGGPMFLVAQPEAPYVVLNLLSFGALSLLAWYIGRRLPDVPRWFLWPWVLFSPWTLNYSAHIINTSYVLPGAVLFFVGACELVPQLRLGALSRARAFFCLGASLLWMVQIQMQFMLLLPLTAIVFGLAMLERPRTLIAGLPWFALGAAVTGATLVPTLLHDGTGALTGLVRSNMTVEPRTLLALPTLVARFLSFASFELARFVGSSTEQRMAFLGAYPWAAPFAVIAGVLGVLQTALLATGFFWTHPRERDWPAVRNATLCLLALVCAAFTLSVKGPASHAFYVMMPGVMIYSFYCWAPLLRRPAGRRAAALLLVSGGIALAALGVRNVGLRSLYTNRALVMRAIIEKNYHLVGERRPDLWKTSPER
jgi:hypothetical protein